MDSVSDRVRDKRKSQLYKNTQFLAEYLFAFPVEQASCPYTLQIGR